MSRRKRNNPEGVMPIREHLRELRKRLLLALAGIGIGAIGGWYLYDPAMEFITRPLSNITDQAAILNFDTIGAAFDLKFRVALWLGTIISSPWWVLQLFAFISPVLKRRERWHIIGFGFVGVVLFAAGVVSGMRMAPIAVEILTSFNPENSASFIRATTYVTFYMRLVMAFGVSFLLPEVLVVLNFLGVMSYKTMLKHWRWFVVLAFVFAAIANPLPSPWPMTIQAFVLIGLYLIAVLISYVNERLRNRRQAREEAKLDHELERLEKAAEAAQIESAGAGTQANVTPEGHADSNTRAEPASETENNPQEEQ
ncbi:sec-independent protein translocase protein TatC [Trueperella bonasi]|uniref:Sec-independent protein translocase protein TatC n=1 Tax=Trueperella bonasi TaxID=312286 RepID=A0ABT9NI09_9ACTO|nr:twin-arginine translocase subunit TatC [Trueperella bonasi]MDP9807041.1 sec-independent protein translocase protein TatC [Trueperella bonasi]